jgi:diacylglycerol kinase (ATP)
MPVTARIACDSATLRCLRAAAILGPNAHALDLRPFQAPGVELVTVADLPPEPGYDAALIFGGDGSVHRQLSAAVASQVPILSVPLGSGNDFARALGLRNYADAHAAWTKYCAGAYNVRAIDVARITSHDRRDSGLATQASLYCCVAGVGLDSEVNRRANRLPSWLRGHGGYVLSLAPALAAFRAPQISVELFDSDGPARIEERAMLVVFANAPSYGHGMRIAPRAQLDDGKLDVCFVRRASKLRLLRLFPVVYSGGHLRLPEVVYAQCSGLRIESEPPLQIFGDGELIGWTPAEIGVLRRALRAIVP